MRGVFEWERRVKRLNEPVDRSEWDMTPQTMDAYYNPLKNQITFPAGILQPPMFDPNADPAVNYGAIGAVIGHEIGHGFDDQGREFDGSGKVRNWWTPETNAKFVAATKNLGALYQTYCPLEGACVNGELTMGENIGDLGGLEMAYTAYKLSLEGTAARRSSTASPATSDSSSPSRSVWRGKMRDDALRNLMLTNPHSPAGGARQLSGTQHGRLVRGVRRAARRQDVSQARGARAHLVAAGLTPPGSCRRAWRGTAACRPLAPAPRARPCRPIAPGRC